MHLGLMTCVTGWSAPSAGLQTVPTWEERTQLCCCSEGAEQPLVFDGASSFIPGGNTPVLQHRLGSSFAGKALGVLVCEVTMGQQRQPVHPELHKEQHGHQTEG